MKRLYDRLEEYSKTDYYGFHMPGHKRNEDFMRINLPYGIDITEIEGFDNLHHADGILREAQMRAAKVFGAEETHFLVNGSTVGILSSILGCTCRGDKILVARHCHKSVYHAIYLNGLVPRYLHPEFDGALGISGEISRQSVEEMLVAEPDIRAVVIVSPSYDGVVSDVKGIADAVHAYGIPLIVDEAHGAHFGFHPYFPERANRLGADVVINSLHKTLPSLTQTALLHINGNYANRERIHMYLDMLQSSSPSYIFMASLDACVELLEKRGAEIFDGYIGRLDRLRKDLEELQKLRLVRTEHYDASKLVISAAGTMLTSHELYEKLLGDYHLQMEMVAGSYVLAMTSVADTEEGFCRLRDALFEIDGELCRAEAIQTEPLKEELIETESLKTEFSKIGLLRTAEECSREGGTIREEKNTHIIPGKLPAQKQIFTPYEMRELQFGRHMCQRGGQLESHPGGQADSSDSPANAYLDGQCEETCEEIPWRESAGRVSMDFAYLYPPGSPVIVPGEQITDEAVELLAYYERQQFRIEGICREGYIRVWKNE